MNISINVKKSHVAAIVTAILVFAGVQVAEATLLSSAGSKLCVSKSGAVFARTACKSNEKLFSVMPGKVKKVPIKEIEIGSSKLSNKDSQSLASVMNSTVTSLSILSTTPRVFTNKITFPAGLTVTNETGDFREYVPICPIEAPWRIGAAFQILTDNNSNPYSLYGGSGSFGDIVYQSFDPKFSNLQVHLLVESQPTDVVLLVTNGFQDFTFTEDLSLYVSVTCIPTVNLVASN